MREPDWVYKQRRQRAAVALALVVGSIAMLSTFGPAITGGLNLGGNAHTPIDRPDVDEILAREQRQIEAEKRRKADRREERAEARARPKREKKPRKPSKPDQAPESPATAPAPASPAPDPATAEAPALPQPAPPQPANGGAVDPRFY
jgi:hypothetical protein